MVATTSKVKLAKGVAGEVLDTLHVGKPQTLCPVCGLPGFLASPRAVRNGKTDVDYYAVYFGHTFQGKRTWCYLHMAHADGDKYLTPKREDKANAESS